MRTELTVGPDWASSDRDLLMLMNLNGRERTLAAFSDLFAAVTPKLRVSRVHRPASGELSLIEAMVDGQDGKLTAVGNGDRVGRGVNGKAA